MRPADAIQENTVNDNYKNSGSRSDPGAVPEESDNGNRKSANNQKKLGHPEYC